MEAENKIYLGANGERYKTFGFAKRNIPKGYRIVGNEREGFYGEKIEEMDVVCPACGRSFHETTKNFDPDKNANPRMLDLKEPYLSRGWDPPPPDPSAGYGSLECPGCGALLAPSGKLTIREKQGER